MSGANSILRAVIVERYDYLVEQLRRRLRSGDLARDTLHDTYLHFGRSKELDSVSNPVGLVLHAAVNLARDKQRTEQRRARLATPAMVDGAFDIPDENADTARAAEAKSDWALLEKALAELPERRRAIFLIAHRENMPSREIAKQFGLAKRTIDLELKLAREYCARALLNNPPK